MPAVEGAGCSEDSVKPAVGTGLECNGHQDWTVGQKQDHITGLSVDKSLIDQMLYVCLYVSYMYMYM